MMFRGKKLMCMHDNFCLLACEIPSEAMLSRSNASTHVLLSVNLVQFLLYPVPTDSGIYSMNTCNTLLSLRIM